MLMRDLISSQNLKRLRKVQHFRYRRGFFHVPSAQSMCQPGELASTSNAVLFAPDCQDFALLLYRRVFKAQVKASAPEWISEPSFLIGSQHYKGLPSGTNRAQLRN